MDKHVSDQQRSTTPKNANAKRIHSTSQDTALWMSKRQRAHDSLGQKSQPKRSKTSISFGAPSVDDRRTSAEHNPSSSASSVRTVKQPRPPTLTSLCIRIFSRYFAEFSDETHWKETRKWLQVLPETVLSSLFSALKVQHPRRLNHAVITTYFLRGTSVSLNGDLALTQHTISAIPRVLGSKLLTLELIDIDKFSDSLYAAIVKGLPSLTTLVLRGCLKVGPSTVEAIANNCHYLKNVNLSFTNVTALSLLPLLKANPGLEVLKLAGIQHLSDATMTRLFSLLKEDDEGGNQVPLRHLRSLKLRHDTISETAVTPFLQQCTNLQRLDVSFTQLVHLPDFPAVSSIEKLSLTSTFISSKELVELVARLPSLKILNIGAMGVKAATSTALPTSTAMTLDDSTLRLLTDALRGCGMLQSVNLVQNSKLGASRGENSAVAYFIRYVGRKLQYLNLSGVAVRSEDLVGLTPENGDQASPLETLILNKSLIDDGCAPWISCCRSLKVLELAETKISEEGLFQIIDSCPMLANLNLTGCRGVKITDRRRFFEVWEERQSARTHGN